MRQMTVNDIAARLNITDKTAVSGLVKFLETKGILKRAGTRKSSTGKGKGSYVYVLVDGVDISTLSNVLQPLFTAE